MFAAFGGVSQIFEGYDMRNGRYKSGISRIPQRNGSMGDYLKDWIVYLSGWCLGILLIALMLNYDG